MVFPKREAALRITAATAVMVALGALVGAATGAGAHAIGELIAPVGPGGRGDVALSAWYAVFGAVAGAVVGIPIAVLMLRRVPLWRATVETAGSAGIGVAIGARLMPDAYGTIVGALTLALLAAVRLRWSHRERPPARAGHPE